MSCLRTVRSHSSLLFKPRFARTFSQKDSDDNIVFTPSKSHSADGLCVILGWGGAKRNHLRRILDFYRDEMDVPSLSFIMPLYASEGKREDYTRELYAAISEHQRDDDPLIAHIFSNNGAWAYARLLRMHETHQIASNTIGSHLVKRVVYDSAPGIWREKLSLVEGASQYSRAVMPSITGKTQHTHPVYTPLVLLFFFFRTSYWLWLPGDCCTHGVPCVE